MLQLLGSGCGTLGPLGLFRSLELSINIPLPSVFKCPAFGVLALCLLYISTIHPSSLGLLPAVSLCTWSLAFSLLLKPLPPRRNGPYLLPLWLPFPLWVTSPPLINVTGIQGEIIKEKPSIGPKDATPEGSIRDVL